MHERTQRAIARMTFVFCCALPTLATVSIILATWTPWWHRRSLAAIEADLSRDTGLVLRIADFKRAAPSTWCLYGVEIYEPETGREVARVREIRWCDRGDEISMLLQQPELQSAELQHTWMMIHDRFLCRPDQTVRPTELAANDLTIHSRTGALTFVDVDAWIRPGLATGTVEANIQGMPAGHVLPTPASMSPVSVTVLRDRNGPRPSTSWVLSSGETPLPCSALAEYLPQLEPLGNEAMFSGTMRLELAREDWVIDLGGSRFSGIDFGQWCETLPHRCTGTAAVQLERCLVITEKGIVNRVDIAGSLRARDGLVGGSLLRSAGTHLGLAVRDDVEGSVAYDRLALGINLNGPLLKLTGICDYEVGFEGIGSGVVLCAGGHSLAETTGHTLPAASLQATLAPPHSVMVPLSRQTSPLMNILMPPSREVPRAPVAVPRITSKRRLQDDPSIGQPR
jgi:hypothetical protein